MELVTKIANMKPSVSTSVNDAVRKAEERVLERIRMSNARMRHQLAVAKNTATAAVAEQTMDKEELKTVKDQLSSARKMISELEHKVKYLTSSLNDALSKSSRKDKKYDSSKKDVSVASDTSSVKISVK